MTSSETEQSNRCRPAFSSCYLWICLSRHCKIHLKLVSAAAFLCIMSPLKSIFPNGWIYLSTFSFQRPESRRLCTQSPQREWRSLSPGPARRALPPFADATTVTRFRRARDGSGAAAARTWILEPWSPESSLMLGRTDPTHARLWTVTTMRQEEWWVSADSFRHFECFKLIVY